MRVRVRALVNALTPGAQGSHSGHNGMRSVINCVRTPNFVRMRVGVGPSTGLPPADAVAFVLARFGPMEQPLLPYLVDYGAELLRVYLHRGVQAANTAACSVSLDDFMQRRYGRSYKHGPTDWMFDP